MKHSKIALRSALRVMELQKEFQVRGTDRDRQTETDRDRQTETDKDRQRPPETDRDRQRQRVWVTKREREIGTYEPRLTD